MTCLLGTILSILATAVPSLIAIAVLWWLDRYEKEPLWLLSVLVLWGAIPTILLSLVAQVLLDLPVSALLGPSILYQMTSMSFIAPVTEETFKALILLALFLFYRREFDGVMDGILYGALVGFGFSMVEDVFYFMGSLLEEGWGGWGMTVALRVGLFNLNHSLFAACTGVGFGLARNSRQLWKRIAFPLVGWMTAIGLHAIHNGGTVLAEATNGLSCLFLTAVDWMGVLAMLILILVSVQRERRWFAELEAEIAAGIITPDEYQLAADYWKRVTRGWQVLTGQGLGAWRRWNRYVQLIVDLAYKKHQQRTADVGADAEAYIAGLRGRIARARAGLTQGGG